MKAPSGRVRQFVREDIPALVALRRQSFRYSERPSSEALADYFERVFLASPWVDDDLPSLVYEDGTGKLCGFQGVVPRPMVFRGERVRAAVATQLMVAPDSRGRGIATRLLAELFEGPQHFTLADASTDVTRALWQRLGATTIMISSLFWAKSLLPTQYAVQELVQGPGLRRVIRAVWPLWSLVDRLLTCFPNSPFRQVPPRGATSTLDARGLVEHLPAVAAGYALRPDYNEVSLSWLLDQLTEKGLGNLQKALVRETSGNVVGWYIYFLQPNGIAPVVQIAARQGQYPLVIAHLFYHGWKGGAVGFAGRLEYVLVEALAGQGCTFSRKGPWMLVHSKRPDLAQAVHEGNTLLTRLDGEWWLSF